LRIPTMLQEIFDLITIILYHVSAENAIDKPNIFALEILFDM